MTRPAPRRLGAPAAQQDEHANALDDTVPTEADERLADVAMREVGARARERVDPDDVVQARYYAWAAAEARAALTSPERHALGERARAFAARFAREHPFDARANGQAHPHGQAHAHVREVAGVPEERTPLAVTSGRAALAAAAAERCAPHLTLAVAAGQGRELWDEPVDRWLALPEGVSPGEYVAFPVRGDSMLPMLHDGDTILVRIDGVAAQGDVVVALRPEQGYVVKRVARLTDNEMVLSSLNAAYEDFAIPRDPRLVVGTVVLRWCGHGRS